MSRFEKKALEQFQGIFVVGDYQRGYRWEKSQIERLLNDLWRSTEQNKSYFLQPVVVRKIAPIAELSDTPPPNATSGDWWELIDGQQRLTTLFLALSCADRLISQKEASAYRQSSLPFGLVYKTRPKSAEFLRTLGHGLSDDEIDFYYMRQAVKVIEDWFKNFGVHERTKAMKYYAEILERATVLWYEINIESGNPEAVFNRLNRGKIPLTNAELLRAWFLSEDGTQKYQESVEIGFQWEAIENELSDPAFWGFITNEPMEKYDTKIDESVNKRMMKYPPQIRLHGSERKEP